MGGTSYTQHSEFAIKDNENMSLINDPKSAKTILREETNFIRGGLQITVATHNAITKAFNRFAEQFIDAAAEIATSEKENVPARIRDLKDFLS
jgi:hypothetical protein